jgi:hypothetical protein
MPSLEVQEFSTRAESKCALFDGTKEILNYYGGKAPNRLHRGTESD